MDVSLVISQRLTELKLEQKDLARAAEVTESYISQLLTRRKAPPAPGRTDIYGKFERCLKLPGGELARLANVQRKEELKLVLGDEPEPLFREVRAMILRKCHHMKLRAVKGVFEKQPFGELERLVIQKMLEVTKPVAREELNHEYWLRMMARLSGRSYEEMRVIVLEFLDTEISAVSIESCVSFLEPMIQSWDIDLATFDLTIVLNHAERDGHVKRFGFVEIEEEEPFVGEPGLDQFLHDPMLSATATPDEIAFLKELKFDGRRPTALYYYRELQNLRDPLHFKRN
jgi:transcriptional regulator with XRE-family HTH domain